MWLLHITRAFWLWSQLSFRYLVRWGGFSDLKSWGKPRHGEEASLTPPVVENRGVSTKLPAYEKKAAWRTSRSHFLLLVHLSCNWVINDDCKVVLSLSGTPVEKREPLHVSKLCIILSNKCQKQNCSLRSYVKDILIEVLFVLSQRVTLVCLICCSHNVSETHTVDCLYKPGLPFSLKNKNASALHCMK